MDFIITSFIVANVKDVKISVETGRGKNSIISWLHINAVNKITQSIASQ